MPLIEDPTPEYKKMQIKFDDVPVSMAVTVLMVAASVFFLPAVYVLEQLDVIKKKRHKEKMCPSCKKDFPECDTTCLRCRTILVDK
jgi:uncharacterized paraquat-inducible protein A